MDGVVFAGTCKQQHWVTKVDNQLSHTAPGVELLQDAHFLKDNTEESISFYFFHPPTHSTPSSVDSLFCLLQILGYSEVLVLHQSLYEGFSHSLDACCFHLHRLYTKV